MLWHIELKFCIWLCFTVLQIKFECRQFASIFVGVMPLLELRILEIHSFRTFLLHPLTYWAESLHITFFSVLQIKFECRQFASILELCLFSNLEYCKYSFLHFSLTRFDILSWNFAHDFVYCTTGQLQVSSMGINFCRSNVPFWDLEYWKTQFFHTFLLRSFTYWAEFFHITLFNALYIKF